MGAPKKFSWTGEDAMARAPDAAQPAPALPPRSPVPPWPGSDGAQPIGRSANPSAEEMRQYHEERRYMMPIRVGSTWMFGSGH
jgi:hypothetical protein